MWLENTKQISLQQYIHGRITTYVITFIADEFGNARIELPSITGIVYQYASKMVPTEYGEVGLHSFRIVDKYGMDILDSECIDLTTALDYGQPVTSIENVCLREIVTSGPLQFQYDGNAFTQGYFYLQIWSE